MRQKALVVNRNEYRLTLSRDGVDEGTRAPMACVPSTVSQSPRDHFVVALSSHWATPP
jgi:hypothetical protein